MNTCGIPLWHFLCQQVSQHRAEAIQVNLCAEVTPEGKHQSFQRILHHKPWDLLIQPKPAYILQNWTPIFIPARHFPLWFEQALLTVSSNRLSGSTFDYLSLRFPIKSFPSLPTDRNTVLRFHVWVAAPTERAENEESTIWTPLASKEFNCIIENAGLRPWDIDSVSSVSILGALAAWWCVHGICNWDNEESKLAQGLLTDRKQGDRLESIPTGPTEPAWQPATLAELLRFQFKNRLRASPERGTVGCADWGDAFALQGTECLLIRFYCQRQGSLVSAAK